MKRKRKATKWQQFYDALNFRLKEHFLKFKPYIHRAVLSLK